MESKTDNADRFLKIAKGFSYVAVPIIVSVAGYFVNLNIANSGLHKDYVEIATKILMEDPSEENEELREWGFEVLDHYSEVKFSDAAQKSVLLNSRLFSSGLDGLKLPEGCLEEAVDVDISGVTRRFLEKKSFSEEDVRGYIIEVLDEARKSNENEYRLRCLQESLEEVKKYDKTLIEFRKRALRDYID